METSICGILYYLIPVSALFRLYLLLQHHIEEAGIGQGIGGLIIVGLEVKQQIVEEQHQKFVKPPAVPGEFKGLKLPKGVIDKIYYTNAVKWFVIKD